MSEVRELYEVRAALNELMIRLFVRNATLEQFTLARAVVQRMSAAANVAETEGFIAERAALHKIFETGCGNPSLSRLLNTFKMRLSVKRLTGRGTADAITQSRLDHERLVLACEQRDEILAAALMRSLTFAGVEEIDRAVGHRDWVDTA
jgi:DNA-binding GntR family transcriptional regulator